MVQYGAQDRCVHGLEFPKRFLRRLAIGGVFLQYQRDAIAPTAQHHGMIAGAKLAQRKANTFRVRSYYALWRSFPKLFRYMLAL
jgi:hypothetical protein